MPRVRQHERTRRGGNLAEVQGGARLIKEYAPRSVGAEEKQRVEDYHHANQPFVTSFRATSRFFYDTQSSGAPHPG